MSATQFMNASGCDDSESYSEALRRLNALEEELGEACRNGGASRSNGAPPPDPQLTELVAHAISSGLSHADVQIVVSSLRKTTTTKQCYETETPGMCGLDPDRLRELQQQLMAKISLPSFDVKSTNNNTAPDNQHTNGHSTTNGVGRDSASDATIQHKSTVEEGFANDDGTQVTSKKLTRIVTTSHSGVSGVDNFGKNDEHAVAQPQQQYGGSESGFPTHQQYYPQQQQFYDGIRPDIDGSSNFSSVQQQQQKPTGRDENARVISIRRI